MRNTKLENPWTKRSQLYRNDARNSAARAARRVANAMNDDLVRSGAIENQTGVGVRDDAPKIAFSRQGSAPRVISDEIDRGLQPVQDVLRPFGGRSASYARTASSCRADGVCTEASPAILRPNRAHFFVRREFTALGLGQRGVEIRFFLHRQRDRWLLDACELQENRRELVLHVVRQGRHGLLEKTGHEANIARSRDDRERKGHASYTRLRVTGLR